MAESHHGCAFSSAEIPRGTSRCVDTVCVGTRQKYLEGDSSWLGRDDLFQTGLPAGVEDIPGGGSGKAPRLLMQEIRVRSLGGEDPLEKEMATHSSFFFFSILNFLFCIGM